LCNEAREKRGRIVHACSEVAREHMIKESYTVEGHPSGCWNFRVIGKISHNETIHGKGTPHELLNSKKKDSKRMRK